MNSPILGSAQVSVTTLTRSLQNAGLLGQGEVSHVVVDRRVATSRAVLLFLKVRYSKDAPADLPVRLLCKVVNPAGRESVLHREAAFYTTIAPLSPSEVLPRCLEAASHGRGDVRILLEDLTESHFVTEEPLPPRADYCFMGVRAFARFHACWRGRLEAIGDSVPLPDLSFFEREAESHQTALGKLAEFLGDRLAVEHKDLLSRVIDGYPGLLQRHGRTGEGAWAQATMIHGDAHWSNLMFPRASGAEDVRIVDWETHGAGFGTDDIANLVALYWERDRRSRLERPLVEAYYRCLEQHGVHDHDLSGCWLDYRLSTIRNALFPVELFARDSPASSWWPLLNTALCALEDLDIGSLLDGRE